MPRFDQAYITHIVEKLGTLGLDAKPLWGTMNRAQVLGHLNATVCYTLGQGKEMPFKGNWKSRRVFKPLILNGIVAIPKGVKIPRPPGVGKEQMFPDATLEQLQASLEVALQQFRSGAVQPRMHPFFGMLTGREWARFHVAHFTHHMKQFGV